MLVMLLKRNRMFRIVYYIEVCASLIYTLCFSMLIGEFVSFGFPIVWLLYVIFSKRLKYITGEMTDQPRYWPPLGLPMRAMQPAAPPAAGQGFNL